MLFLFERGDNLFDLKQLRPKGFKRTRRVNGEKVIEFTAIPMPENEDTFDLVVEESSLNAFDDKYIIKKLSEQSRGKKYIKNVTAIHKFFVDLINKQQPQIHNGSITFNNYMQMVFEDTPYTFVAVDQFLAREFQNLGNDNRLALLQKGLERFQAEFELVGNQVRFYKQIGNDTDFQFRYGHNIKAIKVDIDTTNLATRIRGTGDPELGIEVEYISPNSEIYGIIDAPPVNDERFKSEDSLLEEMKRRLQDEPEVSITIDFVDLRAAGYPYTVPNEGDRVWLIYEPMNDLLIETRIMEIVEYFKYDEEKDEFVVMKTEVTLSNKKKTFAGTMFDNVQKQLREIINDDGVLRYDVLDEAVKIATEALQSAQTELEFNNGIIAREKTNPNKLVVFNSAGIGISSDGGNTFQTAITGDGIVADVITAGTLRGVVFEQVGTAGIMRADSDGLKIYDLDNNLRAAILLGGLQTIENALGLTLIDNGESVFEINQDGQKAHIYSKIDLELVSENDISIVRGDTEAIRIQENGQIYVPTKAIGRGINIGGHVVTKHTSDDSLIIYPDVENIDAGPVFRVRAHENRSNYQELLRIVRKYPESFELQTISSISIGTKADSDARGLDIGYVDLIKLVSFETDMNGSREVIMQFDGDYRRVFIAWQVIAKTLTSTNYSNVHIDSNGELKRASSSKRYKLAVEPIKTDYRNILKLQPKDWYDKLNTEKYAELLSKQKTDEIMECEEIRRIPGLVAEDVHDVGLSQFVQYNQDGEIEGLMYDRLWILLIPITREHEERLNEYDKRFGSIESKIEKLEEEIKKLKGVA